MNCVKGAELALKASLMWRTWVDPAPCDGVARYRRRADVMELIGFLQVQSCTAMMLSLIQPRISKTTPWGATSWNGDMVVQGACVCQSWPIRILVGASDAGRSGRGAKGIPIVGAV